MSAIRINAPAKLNLGLAILGKRPDGYHEIDTIMAMIDLVDTVTLSRSGTLGISITGMDVVPVESNLMTRAIRGWCDLVGMTPAYHLDITKRIPSPAGLGGGSSNAVAVIRALNALHPGAMSQADTQELTAALGADCPFFLGSACARATGIGTDLKIVTSPIGWVVIVTPPTNMQAKTAALYGSLQLEDYGSPAQIDAIERSLPAVDLSMLVNSFARPARELFPDLPLAAHALATAAGGWSLTGAGPAVFATAHSETEAVRWGHELRAVLPSRFGVVVARFLLESPSPEYVG